MNKIMTDKLLADTVLGILFGIPKCCVDFYCRNTSDQNRNSPSHVAGIIACPECAKLTQAEYIRAINKNRVCPQTCPDHPKESDLSVIYTDTRFTSEQVVWLKNNNKRYVDSKMEDDSMVSHRKQYDLLREKHTLDISKTPEDAATITSIYKINLAKLDNKINHDIFEAHKKAIARQLRDGHFHH